MLSGLQAGLLHPAQEHARPTALLLVLAFPIAIAIILLDPVPSLTLTALLLPKELDRLLEAEQAAPADRQDWRATAPDLFGTAFPPGHVLVAEIPLEWAPPENVVTDRFPIALEAIPLLEMATAELAILLAQALPVSPADRLVRPPLESPVPVIITLLRVVELVQCLITR